MFEIATSTHAPRYLCSTQLRRLNPAQHVLPLSEIKRSCNAIDVDDHVRTARLTQSNDRNTQSHNLCMSSVATSMLAVSLMSQLIGGMTVAPPTASAICSMRMARYLF
jgi:hypothetical protein